MNTFLVSYDIHDDTDEALLYKELQKCSDWWHFLNDTWIVKTDETASMLGDRLLVPMGKHGRFLIIEVGGKHFGCFPQIAWDTLNKMMGWG